MRHNRGLPTVNARDSRRNQRRRQDRRTEWLARGRHQVAVQVVEVGNSVIDLGGDAAAGAAHRKTVQPGTGMREVKRVWVGRPLLIRDPPVVEQTRQCRRRAGRRSERDERHNRDVRLAVHVRRQRHVPDPERLVSELVVGQLVVTGKAQGCNRPLGGESTAHRNRSGDLRRGGEPVGVSVKIGISDQVSDGIVVNIALADSSVVSGDTGAVPPDARTGDGQRL